MLTNHETPTASLFSNSIKHYHSTKELKTLHEVCESEDETDGISTKSNEKLPPDVF